jgi:hypothetical protein
VLLAVQDRATSGAFATNRYLLFPSDEDVARYAGEEDDPQAAPPLDAPCTAAPRAVLPSTEKPSMARLDTARPSMEKAHERRTISNKNDGEEEPESARASHPPLSAAQESSADLQPPSEHPAVATYRTAFGKTPNERQRAAIAEAIADLPRWTQVLDDWQANAWRAESVGKMLDRYHHAEEYSHAPPTRRHVPIDGWSGRPSAAPTPEELARFLNRPRPGAGQHAA